ncbi:hypothetical protein GCM10009765_41590 [Fodinicola feengrottensis]|uniref:Uncharacterized protein n=1 Tax=Fodinicola feengrottensis TaxID=435914 RepID=A0ABN2HH00_9ACTN
MGSPSSLAVKTSFNMCQLRSLATACAYEPQALAELARKGDKRARPLVRDTNDIDLPP